MDRTNGRRRAHEVGRLWKTTGAGSEAALALEEFGPAGSLEAARSTKAARKAGFRAAGLETAWGAQLPPGCRGSWDQSAHPGGDGLPAMFPGLAVAPHPCPAQLV